MGRSLHDESLRPTPDQGTSTDRSPRQISHKNREQDAKGIYQSRGQRYRLSSDSQRSPATTTGRFSEPSAQRYA
jgi:hypothetical protein